MHLPRPLARLSVCLLALAALSLAGCGDDGAGGAGQAEPIDRSAGPADAGAPTPDPAGPSPADLVGSTEAPRAVPTVATPWRGEGERIEVTVWMMHCAGCEMEVEHQIAKVDGVAEVVANHETSLVRIRLEDETMRETVIPALRTAIHAALKQVVGEDEIDTGSE